VLYFHTEQRFSHSIQFNTSSMNQITSSTTRTKKKQYVQSIRMHDTSNLIIYHAEMAMLITSGKQSCHWTSGHRWIGSEAGQWTSGDKPLLRQVQLHTDKRWTKHTWTNQIMEGTHMLANAKLKRQQTGTPTPDACNWRRRRAGIINGMMASVERTK